MKQIIDNIFDVCSLEHANGYWVAKRSRLFHSAAVNEGDMLPMEDFNKVPIVEWEPKP